MIHGKEELVHEVAETAIEVGTHLGLELTKDILHVVVENPVPFLDTVLSLIKVVIEKAHQAHANKAQLVRISHQVSIVTPCIQRLKKTKCKENIILAVNEFVKSLKLCLEQADGYSQKNWLKRFLMSGTDKEKFRELMKRLNRAIAQLDLGVSIESQLSLDRLLERDEEEDRKSILANIGEIMRHAEASMRHSAKIQAEQAKIRVRQDDLNELLGLQLQSVSLGLCDQLQLTEERSQKFLEQQFQLLHQRFSNVSAVPSERRPPIPVDVAIPFYDLNFDELLHESDSGAVWLGRWQYSTVAIKKIDKNLRPGEYKKFIRAVQIAAQLRHPNVTQLYGACLEPDACLVTEYMPNSSLDKYIALKRLDVDEKVKIALDVAKGLLYLHRLNILHRDLRPQNILIDEQGTAKLSDFGLSRILSKVIDTAEAGSNDISWLAPDLLGVNVVHTKYSEVYTFGYVLWFIFSQRKPFEGVPVEKLVRLKMEGGQEKMSPDIPEDIASIIKECWAIEPVLRPELGSIIERLLSFDSLKQLTPRSLCEKGKKYEESGSLPKAYKAYLGSARGGFFRGITCLAVCLLEGRGCEKNPQEAFKLMLNSAKEHNHARAQFNLALMFERGEGTAQDFEQAKIWYEKADEQGFEGAAEALAQLRGLKFQ